MVRMAHSTTASFSFFCDTLDKITRVEKNRALRLSELHAMLQNTLTLSDSEASLQALFRLLIPTASTELRKTRATPVSMASAWMQTIQTLPRFHDAGAAAKKELQALQNWPDSDAERIVSDFLLHGADSAITKGVFIADISAMVAHACPYTPSHSKHSPESTTNAKCPLTIVQVSDMIRRFGTQPRATHPAILSQFATNFSNADETTHPWAGEWMWFTRIVLRRLYANIGESSVLRALHPIAFDFFKLQRDTNALALAYARNSARPSFAPRLKIGTPFKPMLCGRIEYIATVPNALDHNFANKYIDTSSFHVHAFFREDGQFFVKYAGASKPVIEPLLSILARLQLAPPASDPTKFKHEIAVRFHALVFKSLVLNKSAHEIPDNMGFTYAIAIYNTKRACYENVTTHRAWHILEAGAGSALDDGLCIHLLPRFPVKRVSKQLRINLKKLDWLSQLCYTLSPQAETRFRMDPKAISNANIHPKSAREMGFFMEEKFDGDRMQLHVDSSWTPSFFTRAGYERTVMYAELVRDVIAILKKSSLKPPLMLDGELVCFDTVSKAYTPW